MSRNVALFLIWILFVIIPLTLALPVFLSELHDWNLRRKLEKGMRRK